MKVLFFGSGEFAIPTFDSIAFEGHEIAAAVTQPDRARGRGKEPKPTPLKAAALEANVPVFGPDNVNAPEVAAQLKAFQADIGYVAAFGQKIGAELLAAFPLGMINLHASLLPAYRGAAPIQRAVMNGDAYTGVTVFRLVERMDAGPILIQRRTAIGEDETSDELHDRLARIGCDAVRETLKLLEKEPSHAGTVQDESLATSAPKLKKSEGRISLNLPVKTLCRQICGLWSWPGAACRFVSSDGRRDEVVTLARAVPYEGRTQPAASTMDVGLVTPTMGVQTIDSEMFILEIKPSGGKRMTWQEYVNGRHVQAGDRFVPLAAEEA